MRNNIFNKTIVKFCLLFILVLSNKNSFSQDQLKLWSLPPEHQLDFPSSSLQSFLNGNYNVTPLKFHNIMYKADGTPWFAIVDNEVVDENGVSIGQIDNSISALSTSYLDMASEVSIVPIPNTVSEFYIICPGFYCLLEMCASGNQLAGPYMLNGFPNIMPQPQLASFSNGIASVN